MKTMRTTFGVLAVIGLALLLTAAGACSPSAPTGGGGNTNANTGGGGDTNDNGGGDTNDNGGGGDTNDNGGDANDNSGGGGNDSNLPALIKTNIVMDDNTMIMRPKAGDDLIVWGDGGDDATVYYVVPSQMDGTETAGTEFPEGQRYGWNHFAVAGKKVLLVADTGEVRVFDTATGEFRDFASGDVVVDNVQMNDDSMPGLTQASGNYFAVLNDTNFVTDGNAVKVIDVSAADAEDWEVLSFAIPEADATGVDQVAIDATSMRVAAHDDFGQLWIWNIADPTAAPVQIDMGLSSDLCCMNDSVQMQFEGDIILFQEDPTSFPLGLGTTNAALLNVNTLTKTVFTANPSTHNLPVALAGGSFGYAQWKESGDAQSGSGMSYRSAIGEVTDAPGSTVASQFDEYALRPTNIDLGIFPQSQCFGGDLKLVGYGSTLAITGDGDRWFMGGWGPIDSTWDYLQMSTGGAFTDFDDPDHNTTSGSVMASDVSASGDTVAFRALNETPDSNCLTDEVWVLGFIVLDRLDD